MPRRFGRRSDGPVRVGRMLDTVMARLGAPPSSAVRAIWTAWPEVVGPDVAEHLRPVRLDAGVLLVAADHPAWATEFRIRSGAVLEALVERCPPGEAPTRLEIRVAR